MDGRRPLIVVVWPRHVTFTLSLVYYEDNLRCNLGAQERRFVKAHVLPFWEVLWGFDELDRRWRLPV